MGRYILVAIVGIMVASSAAGQATVRAEVAETDPGAEATLGSGESFPVKLRWTGAAAVPRESAPWVAELRAADEAVYRAASEKAMNEPVTAGDVALMRGVGLIVLAAMLGGIIAPIRAYRKWEGGWRIAAAVPLLLVLFSVARIIIGTSIDPTSHNLWPMELGMFSLGALVITGVLALGRRVIGAGRG
jgi:hypothetical protein